MMRLARPLVVLDTETTGVEPDLDRIVQIGAVKVYPDGSETLHQWLVNPGIPIPPEATEIHGITDAMVGSERAFRDRWPEVKALLAGADFCAYNAKFDLGMLAAECKRNGISWAPPDLVIDPMIIFRQEVPHSLEGALRYYRGESHDGAHEALADCRATLKVLRQQASLNNLETAEGLAVYSTPPKDERFVDIERKFYWRFGQATFAFGKHKGKALSMVAAQDRGYLDWMLRQDCSVEFADILKRALRGAYPARETQAAR